MGALIFVGGVVVPFSIKFVTSVIAGGENAGGSTSSRLIAVGGFVSIFIGLPLIIISFFLKPGQRKSSRSGQK